jgi:hypothetical protein
MTTNTFSLSPIESLSTPELRQALEASRSLHAYLEAAEGTQYTRETATREANARWRQQLNVELRIREADEARRIRCCAALKRAA